MGTYIASVGRQPNIFFQCRSLVFPMARRKRRGQKEWIDLLLVAGKLAGGYVGRGLGDTINSTRAAAKRSAVECENKKTLR
jgi:hypothetical protein